MLQSGKTWSGLALLVFLFFPASDARAVDFEKDVQPIFRKHCLSCHGPEKQESNLRLDRRASLLKGGDYGEPAILPGKADASFLVQVVAGTNADLSMPPEGKRLTADEIATLKAWIKAGAPMPAKLSGEDLDRSALEHWSFQPVRPVVPPDLSDRFVANPIDAFILRRLKAKGLEPSPPADRLTKIRRLYLVMHGLPPTQPQIETFLKDSSSLAWRNAVEEVLNSPHYGERWARHWLDLVRFGETHGFEPNRERPTAWPFRDYVIQSFNEDKPFDQFVREQIAGDALGKPLGTGFLVAGPYDQVKGGGNLAAIQRMNELDDMINATGTTFLGLSLGCARCHNHKFDPITQKDYYSLQAIFAGVNHGDRTLPLSAEVQAQIAAHGREIQYLTQKLEKFVALPPEGPATAKREAVNSRLNTETFAPIEAKFIRFTIERTNRSQPCLDELEIFAKETNVALADLGAQATASGSYQGNAFHKLEHIHDGKYGNSHSWICDKPQGWVQIELPEVTTIDRIVWARDRQGKYSDRLAVDYRIEIAVESDDWQLVASSGRREVPNPITKEPKKVTYDFARFSPAEQKQGRAWLARIEVLRKENTELQNSSKAYVGRFSQPGPTHRLYRGEPDQKREMVDPDAIAALTSLDLPSNAPEQDRRLALANWIASRDNPLTARVIVNRLWQHHFGEGLVDTPSDFGANGTRPTHPELLDWLANELMANGWSLKHIHRLILSSNTWQQDSRPRAAARKIDAASRLLWRFPPRRLEAEAIRDSLLAVSGVLDLQMGGPGYSGFAVEAENVRHYFPKTKYGPEDWRRMIYMTKVRQEQESVFGAFDCPDASQVTPKRSRSTTPLQAFNLLNSQFVLQQAELFAERLETECPNAEEGRAARAFELAFGRPATKGEIQRSVQFAREYGWPAFCRAMFNANEFVFIP